MPVDHRDLCDGDTILVRATVRIANRVMVQFAPPIFPIDAEVLDIVSIESPCLTIGDLVTVPASELQAAPRPGKIIAIHEQFAAVALEGVEKPIVVPLADLKRRRERPSAEIERLVPRCPPDIEEIEKMRAEGAAE